MEDIQLIRPHTEERLRAFIRAPLTEEHVDALVNPLAHKIEGYQILGQFHRPCAGKAATRL